MIFMESFNIEFTYEDRAFTGLVTPVSGPGQDYYEVKIESGDQESYADVVAIPPGDPRALGLRSA